MGKNELRHMQKKPSLEQRVVSQKNVLLAVMKELGRQFRVFNIRSNVVPTIGPLIVYLIDQ